MSLQSLSLFNIQAQYLLCSLLVLKENFWWGIEQIFCIFYCEMKEKGEAFKEEGRGLNEASGSNCEGQMWKKLP